MDRFRNLAVDEWPRAVRQRGQTCLRACERVVRQEAQRGHGGPGLARLARQRGVYES